MRRVLILFLVLICALPAIASTDSLLCFADPLAPRDEDGLLHQMPSLNPTDLAPRHSFRCAYYFQSGRSLESDAAYVGALQTGLRQKGYYCGPIDGVFSPAVSIAIARMQKNYSQHVTGSLTIGVRRALHLP